LVFKTLNEKEEAKERVGGVHEKSAGSRKMGRKKGKNLPAKLNKRECPRGEMQKHHARRKGAVRKKGWD